MPYQKDYLNDISGGMYQQRSPVDPEFPRSNLWQLYNMIYLRSSDDPEKMQGYTQLGNQTLGGQITGLFDYDHGTNLIATTSEGKIWSYNPTTELWVEKASGYSSDVTTRWNGVMTYGQTSAQKLLVLCNDVDAPQKVKTDLTVSALGGSPPAAGNFPIYWQGRLWLAAGDTLYGSAADDAEEWTGGGGAVNFLVDRGSGDITGLATFLGDLIIFKRGTIFRMPHGSTIESASIKEVTRSAGAISHRSIQECAGRGLSILVFLSDLGVRYLYGTDRQGSFSPESLDIPVQRIIDGRSKINQAACWGQWNEPRGEYYIFYPKSTTSGVHVPSEGMICNLAKGGKATPRWSYTSMSGLVSGCMFTLDNEIIQVAGLDTGHVVRLHNSHNRMGAAFIGQLATPAHCQGDAGVMKQYGKTFVEAAAFNETVIHTEIQVGREGLPSPNANTDTFTISGAGGWGVGAWGVAPWGSSISTKGVHLRLATARRGRWIRMILKTVDLNSWFKVANYNFQFIGGAEQIIG